MATFKGSVLCPYSWYFGPVLSATKVSWSLIYSYLMMLFVGFPCKCVFLYPTFWRCQSEFHPSYQFSFWNILHSLSTQCLYIFSNSLLVTSQPFSQCHSTSWKRIAHKCFLTELRFLVPKFIFRKWRGRATSPTSSALSEELGMWQVNAKPSGYI